MGNKIPINIKKKHTTKINSSGQIIKDEEKDLKKNKAKKK